MAKYPIQRPKDLPPPAAGIQRFWFLFGSHFPKLILLNLLYLVCCIPVFTIPAATAGMTKVLMKLWREGNCFLWADFWEEFKTDFGIKMFLWYALQLLPIALCLASALTGAGTVFLRFSQLAEILILFIDAYWFPLMVTMDVPAAASLKNACLLLSIAWKSTLKMGVILLAFNGIGLLLFPYTLPVILLLLFSAERLLLCMCVNPVMEQWLIKSDN